MQKLNQLNQINMFTSAGLMYKGIRKKLKNGMKLEVINCATFTLDYAKDDLGIIVETKIQGVSKEIKNPNKIKISEHGEDLETVLIGGLKRQLDLAPTDTFILVVKEVNYLTNTAITNCVYNKAGEVFRYEETEKF